MNPLDPTAEQLANRTRDAAVGGAQNNATDVQGRPVYVGNPDLNPQFMYGAPKPAAVPPTTTSYRSMAEANAALDPITGRPREINRPIAEPAPAPAESEQQIADRKRAAAQAEIDALNKYYDSLVGEQTRVGEERTRGTSSVSVLSGLAGSTEANVAAEKTSALNARDIEKINAERAVRITGVLSKIRAEAVEEAKQARLESRQSAQDILANREKAQANAVASLTTLAAAGTTLDGLRNTDPVSYEKLVRDVGGEAMAKSILFAGRPKNTLVGTPQIFGNQVFQAYTTPDGQTKYEAVDLPAGVNVAGVQSIEKTDNGLFIIKKDGTWSKIEGSGKTPTSTTGSLAGFPEDIQAAAQSILDGKSKLNEYPQAKRLQINQAMSKVYTASGGNELAQGAYDSALNLANHVGFNDAVGAKGGAYLFGIKDEPVAGTDAAGFIAELNKLKANLKLVNIKYLKGTGALSDAEGQTLENASTSLDPSLPQTDFTKELKRVTDILRKTTGVNTTQADDTVVVPPTEVPEGYYQASDGLFYPKQ